MSFRKTRHPISSFAVTGCAPRQLQLHDSGRSRAGPSGEAGGLGAESQAGNNRLSLGFSGADRCFPLSERPSPLALWANSYSTFNAQLLSPPLDNWSCLPFEPAAVPHHSASHGSCRGLPLCLLFAGLKKKDSVSSLTEKCLLSNCSLPGPAPRSSELC